MYFFCYTLYWHVIFAIRYSNVFALQALVKEARSSTVLTLKISVSEVALLIVKITSLF